MLLSTWGYPYGDKSMEINHMTADRNEVGHDMQLSKNKYNALDDSL